MRVSVSSEKSTEFWAGAQGPVAGTDQTISWCLSLSSHYMYESLPAPSGLLRDPSQSESPFPPLLHAGTDAHMLHRYPCPGHILFFFRFHCCHVPLGLYLLAFPVLNFSLIFLANLTFSLKFAIAITSSWMPSSQPQARLGDPLVSTTAASVRLHRSTFHTSL